MSWKKMFCRLVLASECSSKFMHLPSINFLNSMSTGLVIVYASTVLNTGDRFV